MLASQQFSVNTIFLIGFLVGLLVDEQEIYFAVRCNFVVALGDLLRLLRGFNRETNERREKKTISTVTVTGSPGNVIFFSLLKAIGCLIREEVWEKMARRSPVRARIEFPRITSVRVTTVFPMLSRYSG